MPRRKPYKKLYKYNERRAEHVQGAGDKVFRVFNCLNYKCTAMIVVAEEELQGDFLITCPKCGHKHASGAADTFFDYQLVALATGDILAEGQFSIAHDEYVRESPRYKYCLLCNTLKPLEYFDTHRRRSSGRQGECRLCKRIYNALNNPQRLPEHYRESADKRRLLRVIAGDDPSKLNMELIFTRFASRCFRCKKKLTKKTAHLDHTLPVYYLWPLTNENATLLCRDCNNLKSQRWPSQFYSDDELRRLSLITGLDYNTLRGQPQYNPEAIERLKDPQFLHSLFHKNIAHIDDIFDLRNRLLADLDFDFFNYATTLAPMWRERADSQYRTKSRRKQSNESQ